MDEPRLLTGTVLAEKYRLGHVLGTGGMGTVYQAEHLALKAPVAVKVIDREVDEGDVALARFMREAQSAASLRSPHVVQILDYGMEGKRPFMVMEMLEGEPLATRLKRLGRLTPRDTYRVISHVARAVSKAHEAEIIHRDLKPDNIFLVHNEGDEIAKVLDFGVAKVEATQLDGEGHTRTGSLLGTPYYMSPEQAQGNKDVDTRSDLWALGVIAFECMTGKRPFSSDGLGDLVLQICIRDIPVPSEVVPVPPGFDEWFKKACARDPDARFQTARDLAESLRAALDLDSEPGGSVPESKWISTMGLTSKESFLSAAPTMSSDSLGPHSSLTPSSEDARRTAVDSGAAQPRSADATVNDSQWEIVPHGERAHSPEANGAVGRESSGGGSIAFVAIIALLLGGAVVFGVSQAGIEIPWLSKRSTDRNTATVRERPSIRGTNADDTSPDQVKTQDDRENSKVGARGAASGGDTKSVGSETEGTGGTSAATDAGTSPEDAKETSLDAIEEAAAQALKQREEALDKEKKAKENQPKEEKPDGGGPEPKLPDSLVPSPAPPPPPQ